jgi:hypothetical protein
MKIYKKEPQQSQATIDPVTLQPANNIIALAESGTQLTTAPVQAANLANAQIEFCRPIDLQRLFGIKRGLAYSLMHDGCIRSFSLRRQGYKLGIRLVDVASVRNYLQHQAAEPAFATKPAEGMVTI